MLGLTYAMQVFTGMAMLGAILLMVISARLERDVLFFIQGFCFLVLAGLFYWQIKIRSSM